MKPQPPVVELLVNPFCMAHRDVDSIRKVCEGHGVQMTVYNLWEVDEKQLATLPEYIAGLIRDWRSGQRAGSVYSSVFVNGRRIPLNAWKDHLSIVSEAIADCKRKLAQ